MAIAEFYYTPSGCTSWISLGEARDLTVTVANPNARNNKDKEEHKAQLAYLRRKK